MKNIDLCRDCQKQPPAFVAGRLYKRCLDCLQAFDRKRAENREMKLRRQADVIRDAG